MPTMVINPELNIFQTSHNFIDMFFTVSDIVFEYQGYVTGIPQHAFNIKTQYLPTSTQTFVQYFS